jgi:sigma-E factor negative regulatory protein RseB
MKNPSRLRRLLLPAALVVFVPFAHAGDGSRDGGGTTPGTEEVGGVGNKPPRAAAAPGIPASRGTRVSYTSSGTAAGDAHDWLLKMNEAPRRLDFEGAFVYQRGTQLEAMRVVHKAEKGAVRERLVSLNGAAREIVRTESEVVCYLPDQKSVVVEYRKANARGFPTILPGRLPELGEHYVIQLGGTERIAGRAAQQLVIRPRDAYRYGYRLWADYDTGLLLKADLLDGTGRPLEQFMFAQISVGTVPAAALQPETPGEGMVWYRESGTPPAAPAQKWNATRLPKGFKLSHQVTRNVPTRNKTVEHLVYSDGLATVSLFVEPLDKDEKPGMQGLSHMGAVHAYGARVDGHQVTAVGEVPAETVSLIARSVAPAR